MIVRSFAPYDRSIVRTIDRYDVPGRALPGTESRKVLPICTT